MQNNPGIGDITIAGKPLKGDALDYITSASIEMGIDQITQLTLTFDDPDFQLLPRADFNLNAPVRYRGLKLHISAIETNEGGGLGGFTLQCWPQTVYRLKQLRGDRTLHHITPAAYVASECEAAKVPSPIAQDSKVKKKIARDTPEAGTTYDPASEPSAWTTIQRLAGEIGFYAYEVGGVIYFGKPTWLVPRQPTVYVDWYDSEGNEPMTIPQITRSVDSKDTEVTLDLPLRRAGEVIPGKGLELHGFPKFSDTYFITNVSYPLAGSSGNINVTATTVRNPEKQGVNGITVTGTPNYDDINGPRKLARAIMANEYDWGDAQFEALDELWKHESGWNYKAENPSSGAYGIPQALPGSKMASEGADWRTNPETQIRWGLKYIKERYGNPVNAWNEWQNKGWY